jgi:large subunit ribosomal protein L25
VSGMQINDTVTLSQVVVPAGVTLLDDLEETVVATLTPPRLEAELDELEQETGLVGESAAADAGERSTPADAGDSSSG